MIVLQGECPGQPMPENYQPRPAPDFPGHVPLQVAMAYSFVMHCDELCRSRNFTFGDGHDLIEAKIVKDELHYKEEQVYRVALTTLGKFFASYRPQS